MDVFLSYASEDRASADELAVRLRTEGHTVFLDRDDLPEGEGYDARIREAVASCDLYLFLLSPASVKAGRYTLTELKFAREQFPNPRGRVLPVMIRPTPFADVPAYLGAVTVLQPQGNLVAETVAEVGKMARRRARRRWLALGGGTAAVLILATVAWIALRPVAPACRLTVTLAGGDADGLALDVTTPAGTAAYSLGGGAVPLDLDGVGWRDIRWSLLLRGRDGSALGQRDMQGCPRSRIDVDLGGGHGLVLAPR
jgi:hypothetical protein